MIVVSWPLIIWRFQLQNVSVYLLNKVSQDVYTLATACSRVSILISIQVYTSHEYTHTMFTETMFTFVCNSPSHMCVLQYGLDPDLFHYYLFHNKHEHVLMCAHVHQDWLIQTKQKICQQVNAKQNTSSWLHTYSYKM